MAGSAVVGIGWVSGEFLPPLYIKKGRGKNSAGPRQLRPRSGADKHNSPKYLALPHAVAEASFWPGINGIKGTPKDH